MKLIWIVLLDLGRPRGLDLDLVDRLRHTHTTLCRCLSQILSIKCIVVFCLLITFIVGVINWTLLIIIWVGLHTISDYSFLSHAAKPLFNSKYYTSSLADLNIGLMTSCFTRCIHVTILLMGLSLLTVLINRSIVTVAFVALSQTWRFEQYYLLY